MILSNNAVDAQYGHETPEIDQVSEAKPMARVVPFKSSDISFDYETQQVESIPLGRATSIEIQLAEVSIDHLKLDRMNPRLRYAIEARGLSNPTQDELADLLWESDEVKRLKRSIQANGGLVEAIIVGGDGTVLEGNCRTVAYRKLKDEFPEDELWHKIRVRIVPLEVGRDQVSILLGELHIAGKNQWSAFEQAAHLYDMNVAKGFAQGELAEMYRQSKSSVAAKVRAYELMSQQYLPKAGGAVSLLEKWSYFEEFYKKCKPGVDPDGRALETDFVDWMLTDKFKVGSEVRFLPQILTDPKALQKLNSDDAEAAWQIVQQGSPELGSKLFKAIVAATDALRIAPLDEIDLVKDGDGARLRELKELKKALEDFAKQADRKL